MGGALVEKQIVVGWRKNQFAAAKADQQVASLPRPEVEPGMHVIFGPQRPRDWKEEGFPKPE